MHWPAPGTAATFVGRICRRESGMLHHFTSQINEQMPELWRRRLCVRRQRRGASARRQEGSAASAVSLKESTASAAYASGATRIHLSRR